MLLLLLHMSFLTMDSFWRLFVTVEEEEEEDEEERSVKWGRAAAAEARRKGKQ